MEEAKKPIKRIYNPHEQMPVTFYDSQIENAQDKRQVCTLAKIFF